MWGSWDYLPHCLVRSGTKIKPNYLRYYFDLTLPTFLKRVNVVLDDNCTHYNYSVGPNRNTITLSTPYRLHRISDLLTSISGIIGT